MSKMTTFLAVLAIFAIAGFAQAASVEYTVAGAGPMNYPGQLDPRIHATPYGAPHSPVSEGGDGLGYPGDAVGFTTYTGTLDLTPGTYNQKIGTLTWSISYTYAGTDDVWTNDDSGDWLELQFPVNASRTMTFGAGPAGSLDQAGLLEVNWDNDYLAISEGLTSTFYVSGYQIDVTPLAVARTGGSNFSGYPGGTPWIQPNQDVMATFTVTAVPEPGTIILLTMAGLGLLAYAWRRRTKA